MIMWYSTACIFMVKIRKAKMFADLGGVIMGYEAFKRAADGKSDKLINGYNASQKRYF